MRCEVTEQYRTSPDRPEQPRTAQSGLFPLFFLSLYFPLSPFVRLDAPCLPVRHGRSSTVVSSNAVPPCRHLSTAQRRLWLSGRTPTSFHWSRGYRISRYVLRPTRKLGKKVHCLRRVHGTAELLLTYLVITPRLICDRCPLLSR